MTAQTRPAPAMPPTRYNRRRRDPIEAMRLTPDTMKEILEWIGTENLSAAGWDPLYIRLAGGRGTAYEGHYIIKYPDGTFLPCWPETFTMQYEEATS